MTPHPGWSKEKKCTLSGATPSHNYHVLLELKEPTIEWDDFQADLDDNRFYDSTGVTEFDYFIEEVNTTGVGATWIWIKIPNSGTTEFKMEYGNAGASKGSQAWTGQIVLPSTAESGESGWDEETELQDAYPLGDATPGGTGGSNVHTHGTSGISYGADAFSKKNTSAGAYQVFTDDADHSHSPLANSDEYNHEPPYKCLKYYKYTANKVPYRFFPYLYGMFDANPGGSWSRLSSDYDGKFIKGVPSGGSVGDSGGSATHAVSVQSDTFTFTRSSGGTSSISTKSSHSHIFYGADATLTFPCVFFLMYGHASSWLDIPKGLIGMFLTAIPPLGWDAFTTANGCHVGAGSSYSTQAASGLTHTHTSNANTGSVGSTSSMKHARDGTPKYTMIGGKHTHTVTGNVDNATAALKYKKYVFGKRKSPSVTITLSDYPETVTNVSQSANLIGSMIMIMNS